MAKTIRQCFREDRICHPCHLVKRVLKMLYETKPREIIQEYNRYK